MRGEPTRIDTQLAREVATLVKPVRGTPSQASHPHDSMSRLAIVKRNDDNKGFVLLPRR
jgi:hypothetical protein